MGRPAVRSRARGLGLRGRCRALALAAGLLCLGPAPAGAQIAAPEAAVAGAVVRSTTLKALGAHEPIRLRGIEQQVDLPISIRSDELVTAARLTLHHAHSPGLTPSQSLLTVLVNEEVVGQVELDADNAQDGVYTVDIDPRTLVGDSRLGLRATLRHSAGCEQPAHPERWAVVSNESVLDLSVQRIPLANDLSELPAPFFDSRDPRPLRLPIVLPEGPSQDELAAAGTVASWLGALAEYRGWDFSADLGRLPARGNALMIAMRPRLAGMNLEPLSGAVLAVVENPNDADGKVLVVTGDDASTLRLAARVLTLDTASLDGPRAAVPEAPMPPLRHAYDAPRWMPTDRPVRLDEHVEPEQLQVRGLFPPSIRVPWDLPPDLFYWRSKGAVMDLGYRYTPTAGARSTLDFEINHEFADSLRLQSVAAGGTGPDDGGRRGAASPVSARARLYVPITKFRSDNELAWQYNFDAGEEAACDDAADTRIEASIDGASTLDLSALPHYTYLPDLKLFADGAFPFSKFADLAQTVAVLPTHPAAAEVSTFLNVLGHIGDATGYPATQLRVSDAVTVAAVRPDADLLVFGTPRSQPLVSEWTGHMSVSFGSGGTRLSPAGAADRLHARFTGRDLEGARAHAAATILAAGTGLGVMTSFESPLADGRTVLMFAAHEATRLPALVQALGDPDRRHFVAGDLTLLKDEQVSAYEMAPRYAVGRLPFFLAMRWWLSSQPLVLALLALLLSGLLALLGYTQLRKRAHARLHGR